MGYKNLRACIRDLEARGDLCRIESEVDPDLEAGAIQRRVYQAGGPALYFPRVKGSRFPMVGNLFGSLERTRYIFRDTLDTLERLADLKINPASFLKNPLKFAGACRGPSRRVPSFAQAGEDRSRARRAHNPEPASPVEILAG